MDIFTCLVCLVPILICISVQTFRFFATNPRSKRLPPGPKPLPLVGNLLELGDKPHKSLARLSKSYGPLMCLKLGQVTAIVVSSSTMAKEVIQTHSQSFSDRMIPEVIRACEHSQFSLPWLPVVSPLWRNLRRICNFHLLSAKVLDANMNLRHNKVQELLRDVHKRVQTGEAVEIGRTAFTASMNMLSTTFFSVDLANPDSDTARELKETVSSMMEDLGKPNLADYFPFLRKFDPQGIKRRTTIYFRKMFYLFDNIIDQRLRIRGLSGFEKNNDILDTLIDMMVIGDEKREDDQLDKTTVEHLLLVSSYSPVHTHTHICHSHLFFNLLDAHV